MALKCNFLYIPHGSDKTALILVSKGYYVILYIPHGSDKTLKKLAKDIEKEYLYIPHGSDKTKSNIITLSDTK